MQIEDFIKRKGEIKNNLGGFQNMKTSARFLAMLLAVLMIAGALYLIGFRYTRYNYKDGYSVTFMPGEIDSDGFYFAKLRKEVK